MPAPLSLDLRQRIVKAALEGEESQGEVARRFDVGVATVVRLLARHRRTGSLAPNDNQGGTPRRKVDEEGQAALRAWVAEEPDLTLLELMDKYNERFDAPISRATVGRELHRLGLTRKKRR